MIYLCSSIAGIFALDQKKNIVAFSLFKNEPEFIYQRLENIRNGSVTEEVEEVLEKLKTKGEKNIVTSLPLKLGNFHVEIKEKNSGDRYINENIRKIAIEKNFVKNEIEFNKIISEYHTIEAKRKIKTNVKKDKLLIQAVSALDDLNDMLNKLSERLREWYGLYYPELNIGEHQKYASLIARYGWRENFPKFKKSMGMDLDQKDLEVLKNYAIRIQNMYSIKDEIEKYVDKLSQEICPNVTALLGPVLTARLVSQTGSLEKLARLPSSTIQILGAEKALFRHMKGEGKPPKYGVIFSYPLIQNAPPQKKGRVARAVSQKIMLAARLDFYGNAIRGAEIKKELQEKIDKILSD